MKFRQLSIWVALVLVAAIPMVCLASGQGEVWTYVDSDLGGEPVYVGVPTVLEITIINDEELSMMSIGFEISYEIPCYFFAEHSDSPDQWPYLRRLNRSLDAFNDPDEFQVLASFDGISPDTLLISGTAITGSGMPAGPYGPSYSLRFNTSCDQLGDYWDGFRVDNIFVPPSGVWEVNDGTAYVPNFQGQPNSSATNPDAPPYMTDIFDAGGLMPLWEVVPDESNTLSHCSLFTFQFVAVDGGNPIPFDLFWYQTSVGEMDSVTGYYSLEAPADCEVTQQDITVTVYDFVCLSNSYDFAVIWTNNDPVITDCPTNSGKVKVGQVYDYPFWASDQDGCDTRVFNVMAVGSEPVGGYQIELEGYFSFTPEAADDGQSFDFEVEVVDPCDGADYCQFTVEVNVPICGDVNNDGAANITDAVHIISYIFSGGPPPNPLFVGDVNCDGITNISDPIYIIAYIFAGSIYPCQACPY
jgi:hypothetical protein